MKNFFTRIPAKHSQWIIQTISGIINFFLGVTTFQRKRPHTYSLEGIYCAESNYPYMIQENPNIGVILPQPFSFIASYTPALVGIFLTILNGVFMFKANINKEMRNWVKIIVVFLSCIGLLLVIFIPSIILPPIKHSLFRPMTCAYLYGVYHNPEDKFKKKK